MSQCIYTGADETVESFSMEEHIFPKCIGGIYTLPKGWVCDRVNNSLSSLELGFARQYPPVALTRMFLPQMGRKKHKNRNMIGLFENTQDSNDYSLGYVSGSVPRSIHQLCIHSRLPIPEGTTIPIKVIVPHDNKKEPEKQIRQLWEDLRLFDGNACILKGNTLPDNMVLLGCMDSRWYLGLSEQQNEEIAKKAVLAFITRMITTHSVEDLLDKGHVGHTECHVQAHFHAQTDIYDIMRVYAKVAMNCLAKLKGHAYVMDPSFDGIKQAILTGEGIENYVYTQNGPSTLKTVFAQFGESLTLGSKFHSACVIYKNGVLYSEVAFFGCDNAYLVKLGSIPKYDFFDCYICDWENNAEYTMIDCVRRICNYHNKQLDV